MKQESIYLKRFIEDDLLHWKNKKNHGVLEVRGCRQVGKTTTLRKFANDNYSNVIYINAIAEIDGDSIRDFFKTHNNNCFSKNLELYFKSRGWVFKDCEQSIIIIDEIQESKFLYEHIRMFNRELQCDVIITGSYLQKAKDYFQSAGDVEVLTMYPLSFEEFINYYGAFNYYKESTIEKICEERFDWFRTAYSVYSNIGGYPSVVLAYIYNRDVTEAQSSIINLLLTELKSRVQSYDDFTVLQNMLRSIIQFMCREKRGSRRNIENLSRITENFSTLRVSTKESYSAINWLRESGIIGLCDKFDMKDKCIYEGERFYFNDLGVFTYLCKLYQIDDATLHGLRNETFIYKLLKENVFTNSYGLQQPMFAVYGNYELDFCVNTQDNTVYGIEVKSGDNKGKSGDKMLQDGCIDTLVYFKGDSGYGTFTNIYTVPLCLAGKFKFECKNTLLASELPKLDSF